MDKKLLSAGLMGILTAGSLWAGTVENQGRFVESESVLGIQDSPTDVPSSDGDVAAGEVVFQQSCVACHGKSISRYSGQRMMDAVSSGSMPRHQTLSQTEEQNLMAYLNTLP